MQGLSKVIRIAISLGLCLMITSSPPIVLGIMIGKVNEGKCIC